MSKIVQLQASNVKRLVAVNIEPNGSLIIVGGANGAGKSSCLEAIAMALGGKDLCPPEPVRRGANAGQVQVKLDNGMVIKRMFKPGGKSALMVTSAEGLLCPKPQDLLDKLVGPLSFDPLEFLRRPAKEQAQILRQLGGVDVSAIDGRRQIAFETRTDVNREVERIKGALAKMPPAPANVPTSEVSIEELSYELERRRATNLVRRDSERDVQDLRQRVVAMIDRAAQLEKELAELRLNIEKAKAEGQTAAAELAEMAVADEDEVFRQIRQLEETNAAVRAAAARRRLETEFEEQTRKAFDLTEKIQNADNEKREALAAAKFPVDGLAFDDSGVKLNGLPFEQASQAEQLRTSVAIGLAMNPQLKVLLIRDGSLLDETSLSLVAEMATKAEAQVWLERVGKGQECSIVIEDGEVSEVRQPAPAASAPAEQKGDGKTRDQREAEFRARNGKRGRDPGEEG